MIVENASGLLVSVLNSDGYIDALDLAPLGRIGSAGEFYLRARNVLQTTRFFAETVMVMGAVGIEVGTLGVDDHLPPQCGLPTLADGAGGRSDHGPGVHLGNQ